MMDSIYEIIAEYEYLAIFFLLMLGIVGLPVPDETLLVFCGYLISTGKFSWAPTLLSAIPGSLSGITMSYGFGRVVGLPLVSKYGSRFHLSSEILDRTQTWYLRGGKYLLFFGYFFPGIRHATALVAGSARLPYSIFALFAYLGGVVWSLSFILVGYGLGEEWRQHSNTIHEILIWAALGVFGLGVLSVFIRNRFSSRGLAAKDQEN